MVQRAATWVAWWLFCIVAAQISGCHEGDPGFQQVDASAWPLTGRQLQHTSQQGSGSQAAGTGGLIPSSSSAPAPKPPSSPPPKPPAQPQPPPARQLFQYVKPTVSSQVAISPGQAGRLVPQSFMGFSLEWGGVPDLGYNDGWLDAVFELQQYGGGPVNLRIGGGSTDKLTEVPAERTWAAMRRMRQRLGSQFIIGLPFEAGNLQLAQRQMQRAYTELGAVQAFEIGNEPNFYINKNGKSGNAYIICCFYRDWMYFAERLKCPNSKCAGGKSKPPFAGPVWGHINIFPSTLDDFLRTTRNYTTMSTVHWYKSTSQTNTTAASLLEETQVQKEVANLVKLVQVSNKYGKPLRIAEMNSISNSGRSGVSDVFSSALWTLEHGLEVAAAGGIGINLHQGAGLNLYSTIAVASATAVPRIMPAYYGVLMLQKALGNGSRLVGKQVRSGPAYIKVWALESTSNRELRLVVMNKDASNAGNVALQVQGSYGDAAVSRLVAAGTRPLYAKQEISIGGITYGTTKDKLERSDTPDVACVKASRGGGVSKYDVYMPPGSAALVVLRPGTSSACK